MHDKQTGMRTLSLVALGSALAVMAAGRVDREGDVSRAIQGIVTGLGFLGAGVIVRPAHGSRIHGLTTAACTWLTPASAPRARLRNGAVAIGLVLAFVVLLFGGPFDKWARRMLNPHDSGMR